MGTSTPVVPTSSYSSTPSTSPSELSSTTPSTSLSPILDGERTNTPGMSDGLWRALRSHSGGGGGDETGSDQEVAAVLGHKLDQDECASHRGKNLSPYKKTHTTVMTNLQRGNVQTETSLVPDDMSIYQMAAQGELNLLEKSLKDSNISVNQTDQYGLTLLVWAAANGQLQTVEYLLREGANPTITGHNQEHPLLLASCNGHLEIVEKLLNQSTADVNTTDKDGNNALIFAAFNNHAKCAKVLVERGCMITATNCAGKTALDIATARGNRLVQQTIEAHILSLLETT